MGLGRLEPLEVLVPGVVLAAEGLEGLSREEGGLVVVPQVRGLGE